eukprot:5223744-Prymnesium_polylepis.1
MGDQKPLEDQRAEFEHSGNAAKQYEVWAGVYIDAKLADRNPVFDQNIRPPDPRSEMIIWRPGAENHVASYDETDVRADQTKKGRSMRQRSVRAARPGERRGHGVQK